jgi:hypothetical protein
MADPASGLNAALLNLTEPPTQELKERCWDAFVSTNPNDDNKSEFRALLDRAMTATQMHPVQVILSTAQRFHSIYNFFASFAGPQDAQRMLEESIQEAVPGLCDDISEAEYRRRYQEAIPFGHTPQDVLFGIMYGLNHRSRWRRHNAPPPALVSRARNLAKPTRLSCPSLHVHWSVNEDTIGIARTLLTVMDRIASRHRALCRAMRFQKTRRQWYTELCNGLVAMEGNLSFFWDWRRDSGTEIVYHSWTLDQLLLVASLNLLG